MGLGTHSIASWSLLLKLGYLVKFISLHTVVHTLKICPEPVIHQEDLGCSKAQIVSFTTQENLRCSKAQSVSLSNTRQTSLPFTWSQSTIAVYEVCEVLTWCSKLNFVYLAIFSLHTSKMRTEPVIHQENLGCSKAQSVSPSNTRQTSLSFTWSQDAISVCEVLTWCSKLGPPLLVHANV